MKHIYPILTLVIFSLLPGAKAQPLLHPKTQPQFVNQLPVPGVIDATGGGVFNISISQFRQDLGLVDPVTKQPLLTTVWGYNNQYPGPTFVAKKGTPIEVFWHNDLVDGSGMPLPHFLPVDPSVHWAFSHMADWQHAGVPIVTHLHGGKTESASDGLPEAWYTPGFLHKGPHFVKGDAEPYHYSNNQEAATIWYHDHALGITRLNVYAGLAGFYIVTDNNEKALQDANKLPAAPYDLGLAIQDRMFKENGELFYPSEGEEEGEEEETPEPTVLPEFFGDFILVNGKAWPVLDVEPRQYRFRLLNGSDSRFYNLFLSSGDNIIQIGSDNGLLPSPVPFTQVLIAPGERKDVIIDFSDPALWGQTIVIKNNAKSPYPRGAAVNPQTTGRIMAFRVNKPLNTSYPMTYIGGTLRAPIERLQTNLPPRKLILFEAEDEYDRLKPMVGTVDHGVMEWDDPISENPKLNDTEIWEIYNETMDAHPIHLHMVTMQIINRQKFHANVDEETGKPTGIKLIGSPRLPGAEEMGWKDTYVTYPGEVTRVIAKFELPGLSAWHCHILSHEDHEMMRPYFIGDLPAPMITKSSKSLDKVGIEKNLDLRLSPNPFNHVLNIRFNNSDAGFCNINVYDTKGSLVKKVYSGNISKGMQQQSLNGDQLANGVYYLELVINDQRVMRKIVLSK